MRPAFGFGHARSGGRRVQVADRVWTLQLANRRGASRAARSWLRDTLHAAPTRGGAALHTGVVSDAVLCVSELVNASIRAGSTTMLLEVHCDDHSLRLSLRDDAAIPDPRRPDSPDEWGMLLIGAAAQCMGIEPHGYGRELWARLSVDHRRGRPGGR